MIDKPKGDKCQDAIEVSYKNDLTNIFPHFDNHGPTEVGQYLIEYWTVESHVDTVTKIKEVRITMVLKRKLSKPVKARLLLEFFEFQEAC